MSRPLVWWGVKHVAWLPFGKGERGVGNREGSGKVRGHVCDCGMQGP